MSRIKLTTAQAEQIIKADIKLNLSKYLLDECFPEQQAFIKDESRLKSILASRRAGKSYVSGIYLILTAMLYPGTKSVYLGLVRESVKNTMIDHVLDILLAKFDIKFKFNGTSLVYTFPNKSTIKLIGADSSVGEMAKLRGGKYKLVIIDECADWTQDLRDLVYKVLKPAMVDDDGTIALIGTPGDIISTENPPLFYAVTNEIEKDDDWVLYKWNTLSNPYILENWKEEIKRHSAKDPDWLNSPHYKQEWLGEWVLDQNRTVYKYSSAKNTISKLPEAKEYSYVLGMDLGYNDSTAFTLSAYSEFDHNLYIVKTYDSPNMLIPDIGAKIEEWKKQYPIHKFVIDGANKQFIEQMRSTLQIPFVSAQKTEKAKYIKMLNSDLRTARIKLLPGNDELINEWRSLVWDPKQAHPTELARCKNHLSDSTLYAWRFARHYLAETPKVAVDKTAEDYMYKTILARTKRKLEEDKTADYISSAESDFDKEFGF